jgi:hypothetical protein
VASITIPWDLIWDLVPAIAPSLVQLAAFVW